MGMSEEAAACCDPGIEHGVRQKHRTLAQPDLAADHNIGADMGARSNDGCGIDDGGGVHAGRKYR
jgi:hypothetical protein